MSESVCILGMGYVGLTLAVKLSDAGYRVIGVEINRNVISQLQKGIPHIHEPGLRFLLQKHINKRLYIGKEVPEGCNYYIIAVATPIDSTKKPIHDCITNAVRSISGKIDRGSLVILRSTVTVGTTRNVVAPLLEKLSGLRAGQDFYLAFCPERTAEGGALRELETLPQIVGGINEESVDKAARLFGRITNTIVRVSSLEAAELVKLFDNVYRDVNIALGNEFGLICERLGLNAYEVIRAANINYPRNKIMLPGAGVGGGCLPKDPYLLIHLVKGIDLPLVRLARSINEHMPNRVLSLIQDAYREARKEIKDSKVLLLGVAFKGEPETADVRHSPAIPVIKALKSWGASVFAFDCVVSSKTIKELGAIPVEELAMGFQETDCIVIMNNHKRWLEIDYGVLCQTMHMPAIVVDGWGMCNRDEIMKLGFVYRGIGVGPNAL